jgi:LysR family transcriptional regulator (chromosome initiation inhibitor)
MNIDTDQLEALAAAVAEGTFDAAARALHVTPSAVSQRVKALETSVGQVLLTRSKPVLPTPSGETLLRAARQIQMVTDEARRELGGEPMGAPSIVPLAVNADSLATWFLTGLAALGPDVVLDLRREDEGRTADLLRRGDVMAAVTTSTDPVPGCTVRRLGAMRYAPRANPAFAARWFPGGVTVAALARAPVVIFDRADALQDRYLRRRAHRALTPPRHYVPGSSAYLRAVRLGLGWGMIPDLQAQEDGRSNRLVDLDPEGQVDVELHWQQWRVAGPTLERVAAAVRAAAGAALH